MLGNSNPAPIPQPPLPEMAHHAQPLIAKGPDQAGLSATDGEWEPNETTYRVLLENLPGGGVLLFDSNFTCKVACGPALMVAGFRGESPEGKSLPELLPDDLLRLHEPYYRLALGGIASCFEHSFAEKLFEIRTIPISEANQATAVMVVAQELTARRHAEREHLQLIREQAARAAAEASRSQWKRERRRLDDILGSLPGVVWESWTEPNPITGRVNYVSDYLEKMLGYTGQEWLAAPNFWLNIIHPEDREMVTRLATRQFVNGTGGTNRFRWIAKDGRVVWVESHSIIIRDDNGRPIGMRGVSLDVTERQRAEEAERRTGEALQKLIQAAPLAIVVLDQQGIVHLWNPGAEKLFGWSEAEAVGEPLPATTPEQRTAFLTEVAVTMDANLLKGREVLLRNRDGEELHIEVWTARLEGSRQCGRWMALFNDISQRKRVEAAWRVSEERFRAAQELSLYAFGMLRSVRDADGCIIDFTLEYINPAAAKLFGRAVEDMAGRRLLEVIPEHRDSEIFRAYCRVVETGEPHDLEIKSTLGGQERWLRNMAVKVGDGLAVSASDITERREAQSAERFLNEASGILSSSLDYQATLEMMTRLVLPFFADFCMVDLLGEDGTLTQVAAAHIEPSKTEMVRELRRRNPFDPDLPFGVAKVLRDGQADIMEITEEVLDHYRGDAETMRIRASLDPKSCLFVPLKARERRLGAITFGRVRGRRPYGDNDLQLAEALALRAATAIDNALLYGEAQAARQEAEAASRAKDEFLSVVSHELRTPLNAIAGWTQIMKSEELDAATIDMALDVMDKNVKLQTQLVDDLLDISRIISGKLRLEMLPLDMATVVQTAVATLRPAATAKQIALEVAIPAGDIPVLGDRHRLEQVVSNLLSNAIKFTPGGGAVGLHLDHDDATACLTVSDTGIGISGEFLPHVFQRFRQADSSSTRRYSGLGIGLAIVQSLVELHGGSVGVSSPGAEQGSIFTVRLPLHRDGAPAHEERPVRAANGAANGTALPLAGLRILVVDDEVDAGTMTATMLEHYGAEVRYVTSANESLRAMETWVPSILISDIGMPGEDGYQLIRTLRGFSDARRAIPALALTAYARSEDKSRALEAGYQRHLAKPFLAASLLEAVLKLTGRE